MIIELDLTDAQGRALEEIAFRDGTSLAETALLGLSAYLGIRNAMAGGEELIMRSPATGRERRLVFR